MGQLKPSHVPKTRLDLLLFERGLASSRERARGLIMAGQVLVAGRRVDKPGTTLEADASLEVLPGQAEFVSRGGLKLDHALTRFELSVSGLVVADVGASTGGFTDCLLGRGAAGVYAIDVGHGQLDWRLRQDPRVVVMERTNVRHLTSLPEPVDAATVDVSFISLRTVLPAIASFCCEHAWILALVKPQFEARPRDVSSGGVVRDPEVHTRVLREVVAAAERLGLRLAGMCGSPLLGPAGNREFFAYLSRDLPTVDSESCIEQTLAEGPH